MESIEERKKIEKINHGNFIMLMITLPIIFIGSWVFGIKLATIQHEREQQAIDNKYGITDGNKHVQSVDTLYIDGIEHEMLTLYEYVDVDKWEYSTVHSPKCMCLKNEKEENKESTK